MGLTYATLKLTNLFGHQSVEVSALVDTGATFMCVSEEIALQLGFDITEVSRQVVTLADGHQRKVPKIAPIESPLVTAAMLRKRLYWVTRR